jgi:hypothetical protein
MPRRFRVVVLVCGENIRESNSSRWIEVHTSKKVLAHQWVTNRDPVPRDAIAPAKVRVFRSSGTDLAPSDVPFIRKQQ